MKSIALLGQGDRSGSDIVNCMGLAEFYGFILAHKTPEESRAPSYAAAASAASAPKPAKVSPLSKIQV